MKFINFNLILALTFFTTIMVRGQDCRVLLSAIAGKYTGDCKNGKAEGTGAAEGTDQYSGSFKAGLPDGKGVYTWNNGNVYNGVWTKGSRNGQGTLAIKRPGKKDSVLTGYWKNNSYAGKFADPFIIHKRSSHIVKSEVRKDGSSKENTIQFAISSNLGGSATFAQGIVPIAKISQIIIARGSYSVVSDVSSNARGSTKKVLNVNFPFRASIMIGTEELDLEISDPGSWIVTIFLNE